MKKSIRLGLFAFVIVSILISGCASAPTPIPIPPTATYTPISSTAVATRTPKPTMTRTPTITPSPTWLPTATLYPMPIDRDSWKGVTVERVCVTVNQEYPQITQPFNQPIEDVVIYILNKLAIEPGNLDGGCDAVMIIDLTLTGLGGQYGEYYAYTGSKTEGTITMKIPGYNFLVVPIELRYGPSPALSIDKDTPKKEPPTEAPFKESYEDAIFDGMVQIWGPGMAARFIDTHNPYYFGFNAKRYLYKAGQAGIPFLIEELKQGRGGWSLLEEITGEAFGNNPEAWVSWWEAQQ